MSENWQLSDRSSSGERWTENAIFTKRRPSDLKDILRSNLQQNNTEKEDIKIRLSDVQTPQIGLQQIIELDHLEGESILQLSQDSKHINNTNTILIPKNKEDHNNMLKSYQLSKKDVFASRFSLIPSQISSNSSKWQKIRDSFKNESMGKQSDPTHDKMKVKGIDKIQTKIQTENNKGILSFGQQQSQNSKIFEEKDLTDNKLSFKDKIKIKLIKKHQKILTIIDQISSESPSEDELKNSVYKDQIKNIFKPLNIEKRKGQPRQTESKIQQQQRNTNQMQTLKSEGNLQLPQISKVQEEKKRKKSDASQKYSAKIVKQRTNMTVQEAMLSEKEGTINKTEVNAYVKKMSVRPDTSNFIFNKKHSEPVIKKRPKRYFDFLNKTDKVHYFQAKGTAMVQEMKRHNQAMKRRAGVRLLILPDISQNQD